MAQEGFTSITLDNETLERLREIQSSDNLKSIPDTIRALVQKRTSSIEYKFQLILQLLDPDRNPFLYLMLESGASEEQIDAVYDLMEETSKRIVAKQSVSHADFEKRIYIIFPRYKGDCHLAESIVSTLAEDSRWVEVHNYFKKNGMNLTNLK